MLAPSSTRLLLLASALTVAGVACRDDNQELLLKERSRHGFVAFVGAGPNDPLWPVLRAGGKRYLDTGSLMDIRFFNPPSDAPQAQVDLVAHLNDPDLLGLCIQINDVEAMTPILERLRKRGITVITMVKLAGTRDRFTHVGLDEMQIGEMLAHCTIQYLGDKGGTIMVLHAGDQHPVYGPRHLAFVDQVRRNSKIDVLADLDCKGDPREARRIIKDRTERYPRLNLWVSMDDWALADGTPGSEVFGKGPRYITSGGLPRQWPLVRSGVCPCVVGADYGDIAARAAQFCISGVREPAQERRDFYVPMRSVSADNLDAYARDWSAWAGLPATTNP
jgi:ABC-type sugar transport system substrate-binding protein